MQLGLISQLISPQLTQTISTVRERISETATEAVTGQHANLTKHLKGRIGDAMLGQKALDDIAREQNYLDLVSSRLSMTDLALETVQEAGAGIGIQVVGAIAVNNTEEIETSAQDAKLAVNKIFSALSARIGQRQLFSGDATSSGSLSAASIMIADLETIRDTAVDAADFQAQIDTYFDDPAGGWQSSIYNGTTTASDPNAVLAIDPAITELVKGLATLSLADGATDHPLFVDSPDLLKTAAQTITSAGDSMIDVRVSVGHRQERINTRLATLNVETTIAAETLNSMTSRDQFAAASELKQMEAALEASYVLTSRLSNLSLVNYLR